MYTRISDMPENSNQSVPEQSQQGNAARNLGQGLIISSLVFIVALTVCAVVYQVKRKNNNKGKMTQEHEQSQEQELLGIESSALKSHSKWAIPKDDFRSKVRNGVAPMHGEFLALVAEDIHKHVNSLSQNQNIMRIEGMNR